MSPFVPDLPEDFDAFWQETVAEAKAAPLDFRREHSGTPSPGPSPSFGTDIQSRERGTGETSLLTFRGVDGTPRFGWIHAPEGARRLPSFLWIPPYGRESLLPNEYGTREGFVSLSFNFFGHEAMHQEKYVPARGYFAEGVSEPETWVFRRMFQDAFLAARVMQAQPEVDEDRIASMGMSQGAGISIWLGAWCPIVKAVCADMPFLGAMRAALSRNAYRYPLKELIDFADTIPVGMERVLNTLAYFDTMNQATRCKVPTLVSLGEKDPAARPENVEAVYEALACEKKLIRYDWGHDWHPGMIEANRAWLLDHLP